MRTALTAFLLLAAAPALAEPAITIFDVPGAGSTSVTSVSQSGIVAGDYDASGPCGEGCGFVRTPDGTITTFSISGADLIDVTGVNDSGTVTGFYAQDGQAVSFVRTADGTVTEIQRGHKRVIAEDINESGTVSGEMGDSKGFVRMPDGTVTPFKSNRCSAIETFGINTAGAVAGECDGESSSYGFLRQPDGTMSLIRPPGIDAGAFALDDDGSVAGYYFKRHGSATDGYVRDPDGTLHTFRFPRNFGSFGLTGLATVNGDRRMVGDAVTFPGGLWHGWIRHDDGTIELFDAGEGTVANTGTFVAGIVASGLIAGIFVDDNKVVHGYIRTP